MQILQLDQQLNMADADTSVAFVNNATTQIVNGILQEVSPPQWPAAFGGSYLTQGTQTTPGVARGALTNTGIASTNANLAHVCDFKFQLDINLGALIGADLTALIGAIKAGKLAAANLVRAAIMQLQQEFNLAITAVLSLLNLDTSGIASLSVSLVYDTGIRVQEIINQAAQILFDISLVANLVKDLEQIVAWIESLPAQLQTILKQCLVNFQNSLSAAKSSVSVAAGIGQALSSTTSATTASASSSLSGSASAILAVTSSPTPANLTGLQSYISTVSTSTAGPTTSSQFKLSSSP
jgi:hypothetical protein